MHPHLNKNLYKRANGELLFDGNRDKMYAAVQRAIEEGQLDIDINHPSDDEESIGGDNIFYDIYPSDPDADDQQTWELKRPSKDKLSIQKKESCQIDVDADARTLKKGRYKPCTDIYCHIRMRMNSLSTRKSIDSLTFGFPHAVMEQELFGRNHVEFQVNIQKSCEQTPEVFVCGQYVYQRDNDTLRFHRFLHIVALSREAVFEVLHFDADFPVEVLHSVIKDTDRLTCLKLELVDEEVCIESIS